MKFNKLSLNPEKMGALGGARVVVPHVQEIGQLPVEIKSNQIK